MNGMLVEQDEEAAAAFSPIVVVRHGGGDELLVHLTDHAQPPEHGALEPDGPRVEDATIFGGGGDDGGRDLGHVTKVGVLPRAHHGRHLARRGRRNDVPSLLFRLPLGRCRVFLFDCTP